ncbi:MAG: glutathione S-transferase family protein [Deltaproteobacteria bacterium]|jgi:glutathione S-transferase|nr:glutathione S-transferase family protein [Deltaproteobacteria bacterium]MBT6432345.1 glutathione S-transferase family protein [Deltaproteobacteria bacterium]
MTITLYGSKNTRAFRCFWMLEELQIDYRIKEVNVHKGEGRAPDYLSIIPTGKVPALQDEDFILFESAAINTYLADKFPEKNLIPKTNTRERGLYDQWCYYVMSELEQPLWLNAKHTFIYPEKRRIAANIESAKFEFKHALKVIEGHLDTHDYMVGGEFSGADILVAQTFMWAQMVRFPLDSPAALEFIVRMKERDGYQRAMAL